MLKPTRVKAPSSRTTLFARLEPFDVIWAGISPVLAFLVRDGSINRPDAVAIYCVTALIASLITFQWFRISSPLSEFFSFHDAIAVAKACLTTVALTAAVLFVFTRLDDAPRSIPILHLMVLVGGLLGFRTIMRQWNASRSVKGVRPHLEKMENILVIGATKPARLFMAMIEEFGLYGTRIVAILDDRPSLRNRTLHGYAIVGTPGNIARIISEYRTHGIDINRVVVACGPHELEGATWIDVCEACKAGSIPIEWLHEKIAFGQLNIAERLKDGAGFGDGGAHSSLPSRAYWSFKRLFDVIFALVAIIVFAPLAILVAALVWIDVGLPLVFWQQRIGRFGVPLYIYKFRTMRNSVDHRGSTIPDSARLSVLGSILRRMRLDEIPQLINILQGNMSLVGPRPLLPADQPKQVRLRLSVRPGITGLAQINGGTLLTPEEKDALDESYVQHASLILDCKILLQTFWMIVRGERRNEPEIARAVLEKSTG